MPSTTAKFRQLLQREMGYEYCKYPLHIVIWKGKRHPVTSPGRLVEFELEEEKSLMINGRHGVGGRTRTERRPASGSTPKPDPQ